MWGVMRIDYQQLKKYAVPLLFTCIVLLVLVFVPGIGGTAKGASRWIRLPGFNFQPSELAKIALIIYMAYSLDKKQEKVKFFSTGFLPVPSFDRRSSGGPPGGVIRMPKVFWLPPDGSSQTVHPAILPAPGPSGISLVMQMKRSSRSLIKPTKRWSFATYERAPLQSSIFPSMTIGRGRLRLETT